MNARLVQESNQIPYLASIMIAQDVDERVLDDFKDPTKYDLTIYNQYGLTIWDMLDALKRDKMETQQNKLNIPTPVPTPALGPPIMSLPPPTYAQVVGPPATFMLPPPSMTLPLPSYVIPPVPAPVVSSFSLNNPKQNHSNIIPISTSAGSQLSKEFFQEKDIILDDDVAVIDDTQKQKSYESLLKSQLEAKEMMRNNGSSDKRKKTSPDPMKYTSDKEMSDLDKAIASLDQAIQKKRAPTSMEKDQQQRRSEKTGGNIELDRFGYVVRNSNKTSLDTSQVYRNMLVPPPERHSRTRSRSPRSRQTRSRSRGRKTRSRSRGRKTRSRSRGRRSRSRSRGRKTRSRSRGRKTRSRSRERRHRSRSRRRNRSRSKSQEKKRSKSRSREKDGRNKYTGPPVPSFMLHPADRLFSGDAGKSNSVRKRMEMRKDKGFDVVDAQKAALDESLNMIKAMKADDKEINKEANIVTMEVEFLDDGEYRQFTQIGVGCEDKETRIYNRSSFKAILPTYMEQYERNLILKNQKNLHSSLKFNFDEENKSYTFQHIKKGVIELVSEETALKDLVSFIKGLRKENGDKVVIFTLNKATFVPLLLSRLMKYKILAEFSAVVSGFCDFNSCITNLKLNGIWKESKFSDLTDVYKHIMSKSWPKESRHCDGVSILSGSVMKKMMNDYTDYLNEMSLKLSYNKFLKVCGLQSPTEMMISSNTEISTISKQGHSGKKDIVEIELKPSDRPGEITIITLKRFECIDVLDVDEVEEEGINEDDYFESDQIKAAVLTQVTIKPGFVSSVILKIQSPVTNKKDKWCLVHKNLQFGAMLVKAEDKSLNEAQKKRVSKVQQCQVSRQIVQISTSMKPVKDNMSQVEEVNTIQVKVLNPLDADLVLNMGDDIALVRIEREVSPDDPQGKTYSQIKAEALKSVQTSEGKEDGEIVKKKRKRLSGAFKKRRAREKAAKKIRLEEEEKSNNVSLEVIDSDEEVPDSRLQLPSTEDVLSDDNFENDMNEEDVEDISLSEDEGDFRSNNDQQVLSLDEVSDTENSLEREDSVGENKSSKVIDPRFYNLDFYVQTYNMFSSLGPNETGKFQMILKEGHGFSFKDFEGRKCKISINPSYHVTSSAGRKISNYSITELETQIKLRKDPKSSAMLPLVEVEITNQSDDGIHYPKGVALAVCKFIKDETDNDNDNTQMLLQSCISHCENIILNLKTPETPAEPVLQMPEPVAIINSQTKESVPAEPEISNPVVDSFMSKGPHKKLRCYPSTSFSLNSKSSSIVILIISEDKDNTMDNLLGKDCVIKKADDSTQHKEDLLRLLEIQPTATKIQKYTSPNSGYSYPSVAVRIKNIASMKKNYTRYFPLAECLIKLPPLKVSFSNDQFGGSLPAPVPVISANDQELELTNFDKTDFPTLDSLGLPDPVPINSGSVVNVPAPAVPSEEEMKSWSVKKLKSCLGDAGLHQYGLKMDLVQRLFEYYNKNPTKVPKPPLSSKEIVTDALDSIFQNVILESLSHRRRIQSEVDKQKQAVINDGTGRHVAVASTNGEYIINGKKIEVLGSSATPQPVKLPEPKQIIADKVSADHEKIMKKIGEIKSFEKLNLEFFKNGNSILCTEDIRVPPREKKIVTFKLSELDMFASELAGRRVLIKERDNDRDILVIHKQISNIIINERKSEVDVLVENILDKEVIVKACDKIKLIRVYVERTAKDLDHQFDIPEDDDVLDVVLNLLDDEGLDAATTNDIVLQPKTYHTEVCLVKLNKTFSSEPFALMERTKASSMQIGMRKMIIIPKSLCFLSVEKDNSEATVMIKMYNASKQTLRITKKTKIAKVRLQKDDNVFSSKEYIVEPDQRRKYGEVSGDGRVMTEGLPVLLSYTLDNVIKPNVVKFIYKSNKLCIPLGSEHNGEYLVKYPRTVMYLDSNFRSEEKL